MWGDGVRILVQFEKTGPARYISHLDLLRCVQRTLKLMDAPMAYTCLLYTSNGGTVYDCTVIDKVVDQDGNVVMDQEPKVFGTITDVNNYMDYIVEGMREVFSLEDGGTGANSLRGFKYADDMAGKTGTAQVSDVYKRQPLPRRWYITVWMYRAAPSSAPRTL